MVEQLPASEGLRTRTLPAERLRALHDALLAMDGGSYSDPGEVAPALTSLVARAVEALGAVGGAIALADDPLWNQLVPGTTSEDGHVMLRDNGTAERRRHRAGGTALRALAGEPVHVRDTQEAAHGGAYEWLVRAGVRSFTNVPLRASNGAVVGALLLNFGTAGTLSEDDQVVLDLFASHAAMALERVRVGQERAAHARLEGALLVARTVAHEINNALTPITGYAELLSVSPSVAADEQAAGFARRILWASTDVATMVTRLQQIIRLEEVEVKPGPHGRVLDLERSSKP
ncbi:MAG TPA: GAF domain-containing protein [Chloroflexota bacterium]|nr:GAF domain-containing protein [Chloroflexota bacterium]